MQGGHIDAGAPEHGLFVGSIFPGPDILRSSSNNIDKKALMLFIRAGKKAADRIDGLVLVLKQGAQISVSAAFGGLVHIGFGF
jgi:hypothetical protein